MKKTRKNPASKTRKGYNSPKLTTHGKVAKLTQRPGKFKPQCPGSGFDQHN